MNDTTNAKRPAFGTVDWAVAGSGRLTAREKIREIATANRVLLRTLPAQVWMRLGLPNPNAFELDVDSVPIPDSKIAKEAEEECREASPERLLNHSFRCYAWGMMLGARDGLKPDPELLYVASMLHDLMLTDRWREYSPMPCFGARAGLMGIDWAGERGWPTDRCQTLGDAISLHLNSKVSPDHGPEAILLQAGAGVDVIGMRYWQLSRASRDSVLRRYPLLDFKEGLVDFEVEGHPGTRAQLLLRWLRFGALVRHSPVREPTGGSVSGQVDLQH